MRNLIKITFMTLFVVSTLGGQLLADSYLKQATHVDAFEMMGQKSPETNDTSVVWLADGKSCCLVGSNESIIYDSEEGTVFMVNHEKKEYSVVPMNLFNASGEVESDDGELSQTQQMAQVMAGSMKVTVLPTDQTEKIGDWDTKLYNVELAILMMPSKQEIWATEDIKIDYAMYNAVSNGMMAQMPGFERIVEEMKKIKGIPVKTVTRTSAMGAELVTTTNLIEYAEKDAPDGIFDIPEGYKKVESGMGMGR
jgi:hypothetical protein